MLTIDTLRHLMVRMWKNVPECMLLLDYPNPTTPYYNARIRSSPLPPLIQTILNLNSSFASHTHTLVSNKPRPQ